jgi:hypothetical protein
MRFEIGKTGFMGRQNGEDLGEDVFDRFRFELEV